MGPIQYSEKYLDDTYEYRHVVLPPKIANLLPKNRLLSENEWRSIGVQQSRGWAHYAIHLPEPHIHALQAAPELPATPIRTGDGETISGQSSKAFAQGISCSTKFYS